VPVKRSQDGERVLGLPKGHPDAGETPEQAATREVREETGLDARLIDKLGEIRYWYRRKHRRINKRVVFYLFEYRAGDVADHDAEVEEARAKVARGHRIFKIKTAALPLADDVARVKRLREALGPDISLRVDANQGWDRSTALKAIRALEPWNVDFVEQPVPRWDLEGMAEIARRVSVPIMADESCFSPHDALAIARLGGVSILGLKVTKSAGISNTLAIARIAEAAGMTCYVGCMIETSLGTAAYLQVALAAAPVTWGCELFGPLLLKGDVVRDPVRYADGCILGLDRPGLGVEVDETAVKEWSRRA